jgi:hypothetical protein
MIAHAPDASWPVVPFEQYMLDDDSPGSPMTFTVTWRIAGSVAAERMRAAVAEAVRSHPLLGCQVAAGRWLPAAGGVSFKRVIAAAAARPDRESLDPAREPCLRVTLVEPDAPGAEAELRLTFHHAACDGVGAMEFCGDVFAAYREAGGFSARSPDRSRLDTKADPRLLGDRGRLDRPSVPGATWRDTVRHFLAEGRLFMADRAVPIPCEPSPRSVPAADPVPVRFTAAETTALRQLASKADATLNELLLAVLISVIGRHCAASERPRRGAWLSVVQPVSMRPARPTRLPACNAIGYAFLRRPLADCGDWRALLPGVVQEARAVTRLGLAGCFNDAVAVLGRLPGPLRRPLIRAMRPGTFVFSYLGDPLRRFPRGLREAAGLDLGDCQIVDFRGAPPPRPGTELAILGSLFGQRLTLWVRPTAALRGSQSWVLLREAVELAVRELVAIESVSQASLKRPPHMSFKENSA